MHKAVDDEVRENASLYALGALAEDEAGTFEQHLLEGCELCANEVLAFQDLIGALGMATEAQEPNPDVKRRLIESISGVAKSRPIPLTQESSDFISIRASEGQWKEIAAGIFEKHLFTDKARGTVTNLVRLSPGAKCPIHDHPSVEECYVIDGDFRFGDEVFGPGDYQCALVGSVHGNLHTVGGALVLIVGPDRYEAVHKTELELEEQRKSLLALESRGALWEKVEHESDSPGQEMMIEDHQERAALYALGSLSEHEARAFKIHLRDGCAICSKELSGFEAVVGELSFGAVSAEPPAGVIDKLLARIEKDSQTQRPSISESRLTTPNSIPEPILKSTTRSRSYLAWAVAASLLVVAILAASFWSRTNSALNEERRRLATIDDEVRALRVNLTDASARARELELIARALESPGSSMIKLVRGSEQSQSKDPAKIYWNKQAGQWIVALNMPPPPEGKVYQLWFITSAPLSAGVLTTDDSGRGVTVVEVPRGIGEIKKAAITIEPQGGSTSPTMPIAASADVGL